MLASECLAQPVALALMGGTSNLEVILKGTPEHIRQEIREKMEGGAGIISPECAPPLDAPYLNMKLLAEEAKTLGGNELSIA